MTKIFFHGKLKEKFGKCINIYIGNVKFLIKSIDCFLSGFEIFLKNLLKDNNNYTIVFEGQKTIHIVPLIVGAGGKFWRRVFGIVLIVVGVVLTIMGLPQFGVPLIQLGFIILPKKTKQPKAQQIVVGGSTYSLANTKSNGSFRAENNYVQGSPVPIGYGKIMTPGKNIQVSAKSIPTNISFETDVFATDEKSIELYG